MTLLGSEHSLLIRSKFRSALQNQTIFQEQRKGFDKTEDYLKHKIRKRPEGTNLINMHILQDTTTEESITAPQMKLKRARLADDLTENIALRPGLLELVEKNRIPVDSTMKESMKGNHVGISKSTDAFAFDEDSSNDELSPEQIRSEDSQSSNSFPPDTKATGASSSAPSETTQDHTSGSENDRNEPVSHFINQSDNMKQVNGPLSSPIPLPAAVKLIVVPVTRAFFSLKLCWICWGVTLSFWVYLLDFSQSKSKSFSDSKNRHKKPKDTKPKVKKLKYHQYIPPDQKAEKSPPPMDSAYARLLQQQQLFLQLQILSQQQQQQRFSYPGHHQAQLKEPNEELIRNPNSSVSISNTPLSPAKTTFSGQTGISSLKLGPLPSNLDDLKVSELRQQLRIRGLPVSGTKTALMNRLRPFQDCPENTVPNFSDITTITFPVNPGNTLTSYQSSSTSVLPSGFYHFGSTSSTPPISPASSDVSVTGSLPDTFNDTSPSFVLQPSPIHICAEDGVMSSLNGGCIQSDLDGTDSEKDKMLVEKQKVINELTMKLQQEQRQVEELRMQLQKQKRNNYTEKKQPQTNFFGVPIKTEDTVCSCPFPSKQTSVKIQSNNSDKQLSTREPAQLLPPLNSHSVESVGQTKALSSTFLSPQNSPQHSPLGAIKSPQCISRPPSPNNHYLLSSSSSSQGEKHSGLSQTSSQMCSIQSSGIQDGNTSGFSPESSKLHIPFFGTQPDSRQVTRVNASSKSPDTEHKMAVLHSSCQAGPKLSIPSRTFSKSSSGLSEIMQPPTYEDAIKQQMIQSQQMDELLDVLIESGEMPANVKEDHSCFQKAQKITGSSQSLLHKSSSPFEHISSASQLSFDHCTTNSDNHFEVLLNSHSPLGKVSDVTLLKIGIEESQFEGIMDRFSDKATDELLGSHEILPAPLSPIQSQLSPSSIDGTGLQMSLTESPWETMEWLDLTPPSSTTDFSSLTATGPSIFNSDFLDITDLSLNSTMDLHLQQW
uniref:Myocardin n=1 Tax=Phascolarctos cinereus TaxID=38626 RepID=A0A6P5IKG3_PHACI|nr:myocardin isoform X3 [Phascolarctos cinereus]